ncbi:hypothetical protein [Falsiroseomonas sp. CW058]|uniref:hypothetical protein n=1 Tax=Falsiroseomonas sp. CW058 TaxID=3388664 RepID=UPI003D318EEC
MQAKPETTPIADALEAAARRVAILDMGKRRVSDLDRLTAQNAVIAFLRSPGIDGYLGAAVQVADMIEDKR